MSVALDPDPPLVPARMLNEFTYCPRLAYLDWAYGEWAENPDTLDGSFVHRNADKRFFTGFAQLLKVKRGFSFVSRNRRPPTDPVNAVLSFLYAMLTRETTSALWSAGLDPYLGFLHQPRLRPPGLGPRFGGGVSTLAVGRIIDLSRIQDPVNDA